MPYPVRTSPRLRRTAFVFLTLAALTGCAAQSPEKPAVAAASAPGTGIDEQAGRFRRALLKRSGSRLGSRGENAVARFDRALRAMVQQPVDPVAPLVLGDAAVASLGSDAAAEATTTGELVDLAIRAMAAAADPGAVYEPVRAEAAAPAGPSAFLDRREGDCAVVRVSGFDDGTEQQLSSAIAEAGSATKGLVLDLRGNGGGLLTSAVASADLFLDVGRIATVTGRGAASQVVYSAQAGGPALRTPLVVLVDGETAAGAEIFAAALRDNGRARILGSRTAGRDRIRTTVALGGGATLKMTTARAWTSAGQPVSAGLTPDSTGDAGGPSELLVERAFELLDCGAGRERRLGPRPPAGPVDETDNGPAEI